MAENVTKVPVKQEKIEKPRQRCKHGSPLKASAMKSIACLTILVGACGNHSVGHYFQRHLHSGAK